MDHSSWSMIVRLIICLCIQTDHPSRRVIKIIRGWRRIIQTTCLDGWSVCLPVLFTHRRIIRWTIAFLAQLVCKFVQDGWSIYSINRANKTWPQIPMSLSDKRWCFRGWSNISNTRECFITFPNTEKRVENTTRSEVFLTNFDVFGNVMKHSLECLIYLLNRN